MTKHEGTWRDWLDLVGLPYFHSLNPTILAQLWNPTPQDRAAAWQLFIQLRTRISTRALHFRSGKEAAALASVHTLFTTTRDIIAVQGPDCRHFSVFAVALLDQPLSPFTSKWHRLSEDGAFESDDVRREFRRELQELQEDATHYAKCFCALALGDGYFDGAESRLLNPAEPDTTAGDGGTIPFNKILFHPETAQHDEMLEAEKAAIRARRGLDEDAAVSDLVGIACSGGGVRSATFCLGVFQGLAKPKIRTACADGKTNGTNVLAAVDYLSTVSGGGYFGAFLSSYLNQHSASTGDEIGLEPGLLPFYEDGAPEPLPLRSIRNNTRYLLKGGLLARARIAGQFLLGVLVNFICFALLGVALIAVDFSMLSSIWKSDWLGPALAWLVALVVGLALAYPLGFRVLDISGIREWLRRTSVLAGLILAAVLALYVGYIVLDAWRDDFSGAIAYVAVIAMLPVAFSVAALLVGMRTTVGKILLALVAVTGPIMGVAVVLSLAAYGQEQLVDVPAQLKWVTVLALLTTTVLYGTMVNINLVTPFRFYRNRLAETFLLKKGGSDPQQQLSQMSTHNPAVPYHLINATLNIPASKRGELRGRLSDFFLFSRHYCGSPVTGYCATETLEAEDPQLHLATAMAISGAAVSPHMGTLPFGSFKFWLTLFNIRLGYWLPNPQKVSRGEHRGWPGLWYVLREFGGWLTEKTWYLNVSDGGHIENTGVYELLRRRCKYIIAIDGEADATVQCRALYKVIRYAEIDFNAKIEIDTHDVALRPSGNSGAHFTVGRIRYDEDHYGILVYVKLSVTGNEPGYLTDYRSSSPAFPFESTADQFFNEAQFEAYRALGEHAADDLFREEVLGRNAPCSAREWFESLAASHRDKTDEGQAV